jgi:asparagine N-glycosylation enzyme membrane subunit Stt3
MEIKIYGFISVMWILILIGGGIVIKLVGPFSLSEDIEPIITSGVKVSLTIFLIFIWVFTLAKIKNWIFKLQIKS